MTRKLTPARTDTAVRAQSPSSERTSSLGDNNNVIPRSIGGGSSSYRNNRLVRNRKPSANRSRSSPPPSEGVTEAEAEAEAVIADQAAEIDALNAQITELVTDITKMVHSYSIANNFERSFMVVKWTDGVNNSNDLCLDRPDSLS